MQSDFRKHWLVPWPTLWKLALLTIASILSVEGLYAVAPCWTFDPFWVPISRFFGTVWPALVPVSLALFVLSAVQTFRVRLIWILRVMWAGLILTIAFGWWASYISTYIWWKAFDAPWPQFC